MLLPDISYVYRKTAEMVSTNTIKSIAESGANCENWTNIRGLVS